jgi:hypothetical protein
MFRSKASQNKPNLVFSVCKHTIWQPFLLVSAKEWSKQCTGWFLNFRRRGFRCSKKIEIFYYWHKQLCTIMYAGFGGIWLPITYMYRYNRKIWTKWSMAVLFFFITQAMRIKSIKHKIATFSLKTWRDSNPGNLRNCWKIIRISRLFLQK